MIQPDRRQILTMFSQQSKKSRPPNGDSLTVVAKNCQNLTEFEVYPTAISTLSAIFICSLKQSIIVSGFSSVPNGRISEYNNFILHPDQPLSPAYLFPAFLE